MLFQRPCGSKDLDMFKEQKEGRYLGLGKKSTVEPDEVGV